MGAALGNECTHYVGGPSPERLRQPTEGDVVAAQSAVSTLSRFLKKREDSGKADDGLAAYTEEICDAVGKIKVVSWEAIHRERFLLTPTAIYAEMCKKRAGASSATGS